MQLELANHLKELYDEFMEGNYEEDRAQIYLDYKSGYRSVYNKATTGLVVEELNVLLTVILSRPNSFIDRDGCPKFDVDYLQIDYIGHHTVIY